MPAFPRLRIIGTLIAVTVVASNSSWAIEKPVLEKAIQNCVCAGMMTEKWTPSGARADCVSDEFAIEIDPASRWASALGQALHYASEFNKRAKVVLFCPASEKDDCLRFKLRLESTIRNYGLDVTLETVEAKDYVSGCPSS